MKVVDKTLPPLPPKFTPKTLEITFESQEELDIVMTALGRVSSSSKVYGFYSALRALGGENT